MLRWLCATILAGLLSGGAALLVIGRYPHAGRVLWSPSAGHGIYENDFAIMGAWAVGMTALAVLLFAPRARACDGEQVIR